MRLQCTLLMISYKKQKQTLLEYSNIIFNKNLFNPVENSQIVTDKSLNKKEKTSKSSTEKNENESRVEAFIDENEIRMGEQQKKKQLR